MGTFRSLFVFVATLAFTAGALAAFGDDLSGASKSKRMPPVTGGPPCKCIGTTLALESIARQLQEHKPDEGSDSCSQSRKSDDFASNSLARKQTALDKCREQLMDLLCTNPDEYITNEIIPFATNVDRAVESLQKQAADLRAIHDEKTSNTCGPEQPGNRPKIATKRNDIGKVLEGQDAEIPTSLDGRQFASKGGNASDGVPARTSEQPAVPNGRPQNEPPGPQQGDRPRESAVKPPPGQQLDVSNGRTIEPKIQKDEEPRPGFAADRIKRRMEAIQAQERDRTGDVVVADAGGKSKTDAPTLPAAPNTTTPPDNKPPQGTTASNTRPPAGTTPGNPTQTGPGTSAGTGSPSGTYSPKPSPGNSGGPYSLRDITGSESGKQTSDATSSPGGRAGSGGGILGMMKATMRSMASAVGLAANDDTKSQTEAALLAQQQQALALAPTVTAPTTERLQPGQPGAAARNANGTATPQQPQARTNGAASIPGNPNAHSNTTAGSNGATGLTPVQVNGQVMYVASNANTNVVTAAPAQGAIAAVTEGGGAQAQAIAGGGGAHPCEDLQSLACKRWRCLKGSGDCEMPAAKMKTKDGGVVIYEGEESGGGGGGPVAKSPSVADEIRRGFASLKDPKSAKANAPIAPTKNVKAVSAAAPIAAAKKSVVPSDSIATALAQPEPTDELEQSLNGAPKWVSYLPKFLRDSSLIQAFFRTHGIRSVAGQRSQIAHQHGDLFGNVNRAYAVVGSTLHR